MDEKKVEELAKELAEASGISLEDAASTITVAMRMSLDIKEAIIAIGNTLSGAIVPLWDSIKECIERPEEERFSSRQAWTTVWDTRKKSQVLSNKPKFMVRKIIG